MKCNDKNGSVLIVVLLVLAAAAYLIMESGKFLRIDYASAAYQRTVATGGSLLRSGLFVAEELLVEDKKGREQADHFFDNWANFDEFLGGLSESLTSGDITGRIVPEDGLIYLNKLADDSDNIGKGLQTIFRNLVGGLCTAHEIDAEPSVYLDSIKMWLRKTGVQKDEGWYATQEPAYTATLGDFNTPEELLLVRWKDVEPENIRKIFYGGDGIPGLREFITVWGNKGKINVNTAPREIIAALVSDSAMRSEFVEAVEAYRSQGENQLSGDWCKRVAKSVGLDMVKFPNDALTYESAYFRVSLTATVGAGQLNSTTILERENDGCVVLFENIH